MLKFSDELEERLEDVGLLVLRVGIGLLIAFGHGWGKLIGWSERADSFPDPLGIGSPVSLALAIGAEFFGGLLLAAGAATRIVAIPLLFTMLMAGLIIHADDPWGTKEMAFVYAVPFLTLLLTGPGRISVDALIKQWTKER